MGVRVNVQGCFRELEWGHGNQGSNLCSLMKAAVHSQPNLPQKVAVKMKWRRKDMCCPGLFRNLPLFRKRAGKIKRLKIFN